MKAKYAGAALAIALAAGPGFSHAQSQGSGKKSVTEVVIHAQARHKPVDNPPALALYAAPPRIRLIGLSPSGSQVAFLTKADNMNLLVIYRFADKKINYVKLQDGQVSALSWADEEHLLLTDSRPGLRGTCVGVSTAHSQQVDMHEAGQNAAGLSNTAPGQEMSQGEQGADQLAANTDLDANQPPGCTFFGVHEEDAITLVDIAKSSGTDLGAHFGDAVGMPLNVPEIVTVGGKRMLMGAFMEMRGRGVGDQPAQRVYLWQVDPTTGKATLVDDGGGDLDRENRYVDDWLFDKSGNLKARSVFEFRNEEFRIEVRDGTKWRPVLKRHIEKSDRTFAPYLVSLAADGASKDSGAIIILDSDTHGKDPKGAARHFHYYTLSSDGALSAPLDQGDASQNKPIFDAAGRLAGFSQSAEETIYTLSDPKLAHLYDLAKNASSADAVNVVSVADDPHRMLIHVAGRDDTGAYYLIDFGAGTSASLGEDYPDVPTDWIASQEEYSYHAADGTEISGLLTLPTKPEAHNLPLIVLPHDGPEGHDEAGFNWLAQALASRGYLVLQPNYRGSDGHGMDFMTAGFGQWKGKMLSDMDDGVKDLVHQGLADPNRVCYVGIGYGGYAALAAATRPDTRCAVSINGISDVAGYVSWRQSSAMQPDTDDFAALIPDPKTPRGFAPDANSRQALASYVGDAAADAIPADTIRAPLLLIHASGDPIVPPGQSQRLQNALQIAGHPATYVELNDHSHDLSTEGARLQVLQSVTDFLAKMDPTQN